MMVGGLIPLFARVPRTADRQDERRDLRRQIDEN